MMLRLAARILCIASSLTLVSFGYQGPAAGAPSPGQLLDDPELESLIPHKQKTGLLPGRQSIDIDVVTAVVRDRVQKAAIRAIGDAVKEMDGLNKPSMRTTRIAKGVAELLLRQPAFQKKRVINVARHFLRALIARAVFELMAGKNQAESKCQEDWLFWTLGRTELFKVEGEAKPTCTAGDIEKKSKQAVKRALEGLSLVRQLATNTGNKGRRLEALTLLLTKHGKIASFERGDLSPGLWKDLVVKANLQVSKVKETLGGITSKVSDFNQARTRLMTSRQKYREKLVELRAASGQEKAALQQRQEQMWKKDEAKLRTLKKAAAALEGVLTNKVGDLVGLAGSGLILKARNALTKLRETNLQDLGTAEDPYLQMVVSRVSATLVGLKTVSRHGERLWSQAVQLEALFQKSGLKKGRLRFQGLDVAMLKNLSVILSRAGQHIKGMKAALAGAQIEKGAVGGELARVAGVIEKMDAITNLLSKASGMVSGKVFEVIALLRGVIATRGGERYAPLIAALAPIVDQLKQGAKINDDLLIKIAVETKADTLLAAAGLSRPKGGWCSDDDRTCHCWIYRIVSTIQDVMQKHSGSYRLDAGKITMMLAREGDQLKRETRWRMIFHLTVGTGGLWNSKAVQPSTTRGWVPQVSEQIGFGVATPAFCADIFTLKAGIFGSGILYRMMLDSVESDAFLLGVFVALDVYDLVELYAAPAVLMVHPPDADAKRGTDASYGFTFGVQVPLGEYLSRVGSDD